MSNSVVKNDVSDQETTNNYNGASNARVSSELKLYQAFIFSVPIFFTFILVLLFYLFYLRRRRVDWSSLRMRTSNTSMLPSQSNDLSRCEMGLKKELREMLPIIVFKKSFFVKETQCSVCLGDYLGEDRLQQIPACGHTFHMYCIDLWLSTHTTCPLCRQSLLAASTKAPDSAEGFETSSLHVENDDEMSRQQTNEDPQTSQQPPESEDRDERVVPTVVQYAEVERGTETAK